MRRIKGVAAGILCGTMLAASMPGGAFTGFVSAEGVIVETEPYQVVFDSPEKLEGWKHTAYSKTENLGDAEIQELKWAYDPNENALTNGAKDQKMPALTLENKVYDNFEAEIVFKKTSTWGHLVFLFGRTDDTKGCLPQDGTTLAQNGVGVSVSNNMGSTQDIILNYADETGNYGPHRYVSFPQNDQNVGLINFNEYNTLKVVVKNHVYSVYMNGALVAKDGNALTFDNSQNPNKPGAGRIGILANDKCYVKSVKVTPVSGEGGGGEEALPEGAETYENAFDNENALADFVCTAYNRDTGEQLSEEIAQQQKWKYVEAHGALEYWSAGNLSAVTLKGEAHQYKDFVAEFQLKKTNNWGNFMFCFGRTDDGKSGFIPHDSQDANGAAIVISGDSGNHQGTYIYYQNADGVFNSHAAINHPNGTYNFEEYLTVKVVVKDDVYSLYIDGEPVTDAQGNPLTVDNSQNPNKPGRGEIAFMANDTCYIKNFKITPIDGEALHIDSALEAGQRKTIDLDGTWLCQDMPFGATVDQLPEEFTNSIPVPGLWDMAEKEFSYTCDTEILKTGNYEKKALWYKKALVFDGEIPDTVTLKINKAFWGKYIYVNGQHVLTHQPNFTPAYVDISDYLKGDGEENILLIKIGDKKSQPEEGHPTGFDSEKKKFVPGIYDSVSLILQGDVMIDYVQAAPDIDQGVVKVQTTVTNNGDTAASTDVKIDIHEKVSGDFVATYTRTGVQVGAGETVKVVDTLDMGDFKLWSPDSPFLYTVTSTVSGDSITQNFGMRKYENNTEAGYIELNNEPIYLRGTNVVMFRFFEDPQRGDKPWDEEWARKVLEQFKGMKMNSLRFHVGFAPDFWYDLCDEMGILVDDEYSIFGNYECPTNIGDPDSVWIDELRDWINERANHPSVVVWDVQNEMYKLPTHNPESGNAIKILREEGVDLSNRPWDNGWKPPVSDEDTIECHPYLFIDSNFKLSYLNETHPDPARYFGNHFNEEDSADPDKIPNNLRIVNEYSWLWISRDGKPCRLTQDLYSKLLPDGYTEEELREYYAMAVAQLTEFWRAGGYTAGILEFCGLSYSREGGETSDNFLPDIANPQYHPSFKKIMGDAMAPVGICIEDWSEQHPAGRTKTFKVSILNQVNEKFDGPVSLKLYKDGEEVSSQTKTYTVDPMKKGSQEFEVAIPEGKDSQFKLVASYADENGDVIESFRKFTDGEGIPAPGTSSVISNNAHVTVSSTEDNPDLKPEHLVDGNKSTRWSSAFADDQWIQIDLGKVYDLDTLSIFWESGAPGKAFNVEVSTDGEHWTRVYEQTEGDRNQTNAGLHAQGRYVRINLLKRYTSFGFSIYEISVYGNEPDGVDTSALEALLNEAREVDQSKLTEETAQALQAAIDRAQEALKQPTAESVAAAERALQAALDGRVEKPTQPTSSDPTDGTTQSNSTSSQLTTSGTDPQPTGESGATTEENRPVPGTGAALPLAAAGLACLAGAALLTLRKRKAD